MVTDPYLPQPQPSEEATWGQIASYLIEAESSRSWKPFHHSYTEFVGYTARKLGKSEALLWRFLAAGRIYNEQRSTLGDEPTVPVLNDPKVSASPDSLELLDKIARVAPKAVVADIQIKVIQGKKSRNELRALWNTYRPVLDGRTKRGRHVDAPRFNAGNARMVDRQLKGSCRMALLKAGSDWLGAPKNAFYRVFLASTEPMLHSGPAGLPELIVLCTNPKGDAVEVHGIAVTERRSEGSERTLDDLCSTKAGMDYFWLMCPDPEHDLPSREQLPKDIGLLELTPDDGLLVRRPAVRLKADAVMQVDLLRSLVIRVAHPS